MRLLFISRALLSLAIVSALAGNAPAQTASPQDEVEGLRRELAALRTEYGERLGALEARLASLDGQQVAGAPSSSPAPAPQAPPSAAAAGPPAALSAGGPSAALPVYGSPLASSKVFNPDMAVIGDFLGSAGKNAVEPPTSLEMHEAEASFQAIVDPYARADFFFAFSPEGVEVEEGFITFPTLPGGLLMKVGKMRGAFGKVNAMHNHVLPWADRPLVTRNIVGGEEGISDAGISVSRLFPNRFVFLEATGEVYRGESEVFSAPRSRDLTYLGRLRAYRDVTESSNLDLGGSFAYGHNDSGSTTRLFGVDATFRYRPLRRAIYRRLVARTELVWSRREGAPPGIFLDGSQPGIGGTPFGDLDPQSARQDAFGAYVSAEYQFARRWFAGARYDHSERAAEPGTDKGGSLLLTYWPSEFSQIRGQLRRTRYAEGKTANELLFQFLFSIGAHGAHTF